MRCQRWVTYPKEPSEALSFANLARRYAGKLVRVHRTAAEPVEGRLRQMVEGEGRGFLVLDGSDEGLMLIAVDHASSLDIFADPIFERLRARRAKRLSITMDADRVGEQVQLTLFQCAPGVRWIPTYRVNADGEDEALALAGLGRAQHAKRFTFSIESFSLRRGGRAAVPLLDDTVFARQQYTIDLALQRRDRSDDLIQKDEGPEPCMPSGKPIVWHQLEATNETAKPWITGPALILHQAMPLGQNIISYTARGERVSLPTTAAVNVQALHDESLVRRQDEVRRWRGNQLSRIEKEGKLQVVNHRDSTVEMRIRMRTGGEVTEASHEGEMRYVDCRGDDWSVGHEVPINKHSRVTWSVEGDPGDRVKLTYDVDLYIH